MDGGDSAILILMKISHFDRTPLYVYYGMVNKIKRRMKLISKYLNLKLIWFQANFVVSKLAIIFTSL